MWPSQDIVCGPCSPPVTYRVAIRRRGPRRVRPFVVSSPDSVTSEVAPELTRVFGVFPAPLSTMLSHRLGFRPVVMMGGVLISLGTVASAFCRSINEMYFTMGVVSGTDQTLSFTTWDHNHAFDQEAFRSSG